MLALVFFSLSLFLSLSLSIDCWYLSFPPLCSHVSDGQFHVCVSLLTLSVVSYLTVLTYVCCFHPAQKIFAILSAVAPIAAYRSSR